MNALTTFLLGISMITIGNAKTLQVGGRSLTIPEPAGFVEVTPEMLSLFSATRKLEDPDNESLAYYIPEEMEEAAIAGEIPPVERYLVLKAQGNTKFDSVGDATFESLVAGVKSTNQMRTAELKTTMGDSFSPEAVVELNGLAILPPHRESKTAFAHSMLIEQAALGGEGEEQVMAATKTIANVGGKVLLLFAYGSEKDLEWTRSASGSWTDAVLGANPAPPVDPESRGDGSGLESPGGSMIKSGLIGAVIGGVLVFLLFLAKNRRAA